ncbi:MAG: DUF1365 family protein [Deltaproteobacteria bacterium]|nr:DUF1365 family protein [Deltaproteobacteria bacterium]
MFDPKQIYLVKGSTTHERFKPVHNRFHYSHDYLMFELHNFDSLRKLRFFSVNKFNLMSIVDTDYFFGLKKSILHQLKEFFEMRLKRDLNCQYVFCLTTPRVLNFVFNPVNFYFGFNKNNPVFFLAEINNTFWERYIYFEDLSVREKFYFTWKKNFFISPFFPREGEYSVFLNIASSIYIQFIYRIGKERVFSANYSGQVTQLNGRNSLLIHFLRNPFSFYSTLPKIYAQAVKLWLLKGVGVFRKPSPEGTTLVWARPYMVSTQILQNAFRNKLRRCERGRLVIVLPDGHEEVYEGGKSGYSAELRIKDFVLFWKIITSGQIGFCDAFVDRLWDSPDPAMVIAYFLDNWRVVGKTKGFGVVRVLHSLVHRLRSNSKSQARKNIIFHYDNPLWMFQLILDPTLTYSCAFFDENHTDLLSAQINKIQIACDELELSSADHVLEIGSGFGSFAIYAAKHYGCKVTTITLSKVQFDYVKNLIKAEGLENLVTVLLEDYRNIRGKFDKIVSIEMIEAVGNKFLPQYFAKLDHLLKPGGSILLQAIVYPDYDYQNYLRRADWIQTRIFPGSCLPSLQAIHQAFKQTKLQLDFAYNRSKDYAKTLKLWRDNLESNKEIFLQNGTETQLRTWLLYLCSCQAEFQTDWLRLMRLMLRRPNERQSYFL